MFTDFSNKVSIGKHAVCMSSKYHVLTNFIWIFNFSWQVFTQIDRVFFQENYSNNVGDTVDKSPDSQYTGIPVKRSGFHTWSRQYVLFMGKTLYSHSASLHPECKWVPANFQGSLVKCWRVTMWWTSIPSRRKGGGGGVGGSNTPSRYMLWKPAKAPIGWASRLEYRLYLTYLH